MAKPLQKIMHYIGKHGMVRPRDIEAIGLPREYLIRLHRQGKLNRSGRGIYTVPDANVTERHFSVGVVFRHVGIWKCVDSTCRPIELALPVETNEILPR